MAWSQYKRIMDANTQHRDKNEQPWGTEFSKGVREVVGMIPEDNPVINTVGAALGGFADQWSQTTPGRMEDAALDWVGRQAPKINVDSLAAQMAVGMFLPGPGEMGVANRAVKASRLGQRSLFNVQDVSPGMNLAPGRTRFNPVDGMPIDEGIESAIAMERARKLDLSDFITKEAVPEFTKSKTLTIKGKEIDVPLTPYTLEELTEKVNNLIKVREAAGIKNPRRGWQGLFGNYIGKDGWPIDFGGGRATSSRPLHVKSTKNANERFIKENLWPTDETNLKARRAWDKNLSHKHHVRHLSPSTMFTFVKDKTGGYVRRSKRQLDNVAKILKKKHGIDLGDQDLNEIMQSRAAHLEDPIASHRISRGSTDLENRVMGETFKDGTDLTKIKTYKKGQKHGFSEEGLELLGNIKSDNDLADAVALFYEITDEAYQGSAALASNIVDAGILKDPMTTKLLKKYGDNETKFLQALLEMPQWENDPRLLKRYSEKYRDYMKTKGRVQIGK